MNPKPIYAHDFTEEEWELLLTAPVNLVIDGRDLWRPLAEKIHHLQYPKE